MNPVICGDVLIASTNGSIIKLKMDGDKGQPCLVPFEIRKGWESMLEVNTIAEDVEYTAKPADSIGPVKTNFLRV